ncbi:MAG TPA: polymer-forming cytoskeletal protein [Polyangiales bacterium]|nr:polymer-forming cytoskeletal protein [Polyangiales bacterium]
MSGLDKTEADLKQTTVEEGTQFKGTLQSTCPVVVRGVVDGELNAPSVVVTESGSVFGSVKAQSLHSTGVLAGRIDVDDLVLLGTVRNDTVIRAKTLEVKLQQPESGKLELRFGECLLEVGDDPGLEVGEPAPGRSTPKKGSARRNEPPSPIEAAGDKATVEAASKTESAAT